MIGRSAKVISEDLKAKIAEFRAAGVRVVEEKDAFPKDMKADVVFPEGSVPVRMFGDATSVIPINKRGHEASLVGIQFVHREVPGKADIYWLSNFTGQKQCGTVRLRKEAKYAALFNPETGETSALECTDAGDGYTALEFSLAPGDALFYVLTDAPLGVSAPRKTGAVVSAQKLERYWDVEFVQKGGERALETFSVLNDWTTNSDPVVKYFSGTAHYTTHFTMDSLKGLDQARIDLGEVNVMAELVVNGHPAGVLWRAPFVSADILPYLKKGDNKLEVYVTNLWVNRMIGDRQKNVEPVTRIRRFYEAGDKLQPSGLLGPVVLTGYGKP
jgi:hypothetical protein